MLGLVWVVGGLFLWGEPGGGPDGGPFVPLTNGEFLGLFLGELLVAGCLEENCETVWFDVWIF